ncbi:MAG: Ribosomal RNA small subunit methyltransferase G [Tenericutes bacterium ADurb.BinA155]|jgi:16S rRNA (guanine527-N7)-methyltransferase|nr:MAG: Ribosomal RNA small subunit methyltransferase G [Tenericutes bacterium ADurb.BinA155]
MTYEELHKLCWDSDIVISVETMAKLRDYAHLLMKWNKKMNLTAIDQEDEIVEKHFYDCIIPAKVFDFHDKTLVDLGTGAGFPGLLLSVLYPTLQVTLIDATAKKFEFLKDVKEQLNLTNVKFVVGRVEEQTALRETFDVCTARGFGSLSEIIEVGVPLLKVGGTLIAMKSSKGVEEVLNSNKALQQLESKITNQQRDTLPSNHDVRLNIFITKCQKTTPKYPRKWAEIVAKPL